MAGPMARRMVAGIIAALMMSALLSMALPAGALACGFNTWYLPEGYTGGNFDTYILIQNPNPWKAEADVRFMTDTEVTDPVRYSLAPNSRTTMAVDDHPGLEDANVSTMVEANSGVVVERAMYFKYEGGKAGGSNSIGASGTSCTWYLAEGYTGEDFDTYILVMNPNDVPVNFDVRYFTSAPTGAGKEAGPTHVDKSYTVGPMRRFTIHVDEIAGLEDCEVSASVRVTGAGGVGGDYGVVLPGIVCERAMYFSYMGIDGGHCSIGAPSASSRWYCPEGRTAGEYDTYILVMNPNETATRVKATFMVPAGGAGAAGRRARPHEPTPPAPPEPLPDKVITRQFTLAPLERYTIPLDQVEGLEATDVATMIESWPEVQEGGRASSVHNPVVVERAMYFTRGHGGDGHNSIGATEKLEYWLMAEGYTAGGFDSWILVQNPNACDVKVRATFMKPEGDPVEREYEIKRMSRLTIPIDEIEGLESSEVSTRLQVLGPVGGGLGAASEYGIVAERAMYFEYKGIVGGHCSLGVGE